MECFAQNWTPTIHFLDWKKVCSTISSKYNMQFCTVVANRIHNLSKGSRWRFINSKLNLADDASWGQGIDPFLSSKRWLQGPEFLEKLETGWARNPVELGSILPDDPEVRKEAIVSNIVTSISEKTPTSKLIEHYSSSDDLKRTVAWMMKLKNLLLQMNRKREK